MSPILIFTLCFNLVRTQLTYSFQSLQLQRTSLQQEDMGHGK